MFNIARFVVVRWRLHAQFRGTLSAKHVVVPVVEYDVTFSFFFIRKGSLRQACDYKGTVLVAYVVSCREAIIKRKCPILDQIACSKVHANGSSNEYDINNRCNVKR